MGTQEKFSQSKESFCNVNRKHCVIQKSLYVLRDTGAQTQSCFDWWLTLFGARIGLGVSTALLCKLVCQGVLFESRDLLFS